MKTIFFAMIGMTVIKADELVDPDLLRHPSSGYEEKWQVERLENLPGKDVIQMLIMIYDSKPTPSFIEKSYIHISRNTNLPSDAQKHFSQEALSTERRLEHMYWFILLSNVKTEWSIRLLVDLVDDRKPIIWESSSSDIRINTENLVYGETGEDEIIEMLRSNYIMAEGTLVRLLREANLVPKEKSEEELREKIRDPVFRERIPDILLTAWGEKAVMNSDIGLGPDNRPLAKRPAGDSVHPGSSRRVPPRGMAGVTDAASPAPGRAFPWLPLGGSLLVLVAAAAMAAKRRSGTSAPGPPRRPG